MTIDKIINKEIRRIEKREIRVPYNTLIVIFSILLLGIVVLMRSHVEYTGMAGLDLGECVEPYEDMEITQNTLLCNGTYYLDDANGDGAIKIAADNVTLDCNGAEMVGNMLDNSYAVTLNFKNNVIIYNCKINQYYNGIYSSYGKNLTIFKNSISNILNIGLLFFHSLRINISNNILSNNGSGKGIYFASNNILLGQNNLVQYNNISQWNIGVKLDYNITNTTILKNFFFNNTQFSILTEIGSNNCHILNNTIIYGGWDSLAIRGYNHSILNNYLEDWVHHGIDTLSQSGSIYTSSGGFHLIQDNTLIDNETLDDPLYPNSSSICIDILTSNSNIINRNYCVNSKISVEGIKTITYDNIISNNIVDGGSYAPLYAFSHNSVWKNNTIINNREFLSNLFEVYSGAPWDDKDTLIDVIFENNHYLDNMSRYKLSDSNYNISINESSNWYHFFSLGNGASINFSFDGTKHIEFRNNSLKIIFITEPFNDIFDIKNQVLLANNVTHYNITLSQGQEIAVGNYSDETSYCGDEMCNGNEDCNLCEQDCGKCEFCGDYICQPNEDCNTCSQDCGVCQYCGDGLCNNGESCSSCSKDCGACKQSGDAGGGGSGGAKLPIKKNTTLVTKPKRNTSLIKEEPKQTVEETQELEQQANLQQQEAKEQISEQPSITGNFMLNFGKRQAVIPVLITIIIIASLLASFFIKRNDPLKQWIRDAKNQGYNEKQILAMLKKRGWTEEALHKRL